MSRYLTVAILFLLSAEAPGELFDKYCIRPPQYGKGTLRNSNKECEVVFTFKTNSDEDAGELCERNAPYYVIESKAGARTTCVYERPMFACGDDEAGIEASCLIVKGFDTFDKHAHACGKNRKLHKLINENERKWATLFFVGKDSGIWVNVADGAALNIKSVEKTRKKRDANATIEESERTTAILLMTQASSTGKFRKGDLVYADPKERHPFLCSKEAPYFESGIEQLVSSAAKLGFTTTMAKDKNGDKRPFLVLDNVFAVEAKNKFEADYESFDHICDVFPNGYVASRFDFMDHNEYRKVITKGRWRLFRTKVARHKAAAFEPSNSCEGDSDKLMRKKFNFITDSKSLAAVPDNHWEGSYPMNMCADTPRITAVMGEGGYRDFPAIARLPVICTFGNPPDVKARPDSGVCSAAAHLDKKTGTCVCNDPESDASQKEPEKYGHLPTGMICITCITNEIVRSVVFILDNTGSVEIPGWEAQKRFVSSMVDQMKGARTGVVELHCPSKIILEMGKHTPSEIMSNIGGWTDGWTGTGRAFMLADKMIRAESTKEKAVLILSDGQPDNCTPKLAKGPEDESEKNKQNSYASGWRRDGIRIKYVAIPGTYKYGWSNIEEIAGGSENIIKGRTFATIDDADIVVNALEDICNPVD